MFIIIPIGGIGKRFQDENYTRPKPLINVLGKPVLFWVLDNLKFEKDDTLIIVYNNYLEQFNFENMVFHRYKNIIPIIFVPIFQQTTGASHTLSLALKNVNQDEKFVSLDCDSFYTCDILKLCRNSKNSNIIYFEDYDEKPIYSYIDINSDGNITEIKEKIKISNNANTGCYMFSSGKLFLEYFKKLNTTSEGSGENYTSHVYSEMLKSNEIIKGIKMEKSDFHCLGTPFQQKIFSMNKNFNKEKYRFCFDLDGTLVSFPIISGDYTSVKPIQKNIDFLNFLKNNNHTIIIYTARRMKTHGGNTGKVMADIAKITFDTLEKFKISYDEIYFGKPHADFYIDDLSINFNESLDKATGFYDMMIEPRDFNTIREGNISTIIKKGEKLKGQIYFYRNIPQSISHFFPKLYSFSDTHYEIEKIIGLPISHQFVDGNLKINTLKKILESLNEMHGTEWSSGTKWSSDNAFQGVEWSIDIHSNYLQKIKKRYEENKEFYRSFKDSDKIYSELEVFFENYKGVKGIIHGDPVFSNILITEKDELKFIDMRGNLGEIPTIFGDIFYDYAKVYQSLLGYDFILLDRPIKINLDLIKYFENYILEKFNENILENIKTITKSLIFSLLPLHTDRLKCELYYKLICI